MLHARRLGLAHPLTGERLGLESPVAADFEEVLRVQRSAPGRRG
jgi:hypothetical protein